MARTKDQKKEILKDLSDKVAKAKSVVFTKFSCLGVKENEELRKELRNEKSEYFVAKKTLMDLAFKDKKVEGLDIKSFDFHLMWVILSPLEQWADIYKHALFTAEKNNLFNIIELYILHWI